MVQFLADPVACGYASDLFSLFPGEIFRFAQDGIYAHDKKPTFSVYYSRDDNFERVAPHGKGTRLGRVPISWVHGVGVGAKENPGGAQRDLLAS